MRIVGLFRRPQGQALNGYDTPTTLVDKTLLATHSFVDKDESRTTSPPSLGSLRAANERIVAQKISSSEELVLALWSQQWPRLRRTFRFCTLTFDDRSGEDAPFDLQFLPMRDSAVRSRFSTATDAGRLHPPYVEWLEDALFDLSQVVSTRLRSFLRQVGGGVAGGREAFIPLCRLHRLLNDFDAKPDYVDEAVKLIEAQFRMHQVYFVALGKRG